MLRKIVLRFEEVGQRSRKEVSGRWCAHHAIDYAEYCRNLNPKIWNETEEYSLKLQTRAQSVLRQVGIDLGGGGNYAMLFFLARLLRPSIVIETGVAAGFSSHALLTALQQNGHGDLFSSDFPYFRLQNPERFVGILVDEELKPRWKLYLEGDRANLPKICTSTGRVQLAHYDSDKSYAGRKFFCRIILPMLDREGVMLMDDIGDNTFFMEFVEEAKLTYKIFEFEGKYIGAIGLP
jgi:predicted O-methyltransferase YrrM